MTTDTRAAEILSTVQGGVTVPLLRAAVAGFFISLPVLIITAASAVNGYEFARRWWWACWLLAWTVTQVAWWLYDERGRARMQQAVIYAIEMQFNVDVDGDGDIADHPIPEMRIDVTKKSESGYDHTTRTRLPVKPDQAWAFAWRVLELNHPTSERTWTGANNVFSIGEFHAWRDWLLSENAIEPKSDKDIRQGFTITERGDQILREIINSRDLPYPTRESA